LVNLKKLNLKKIGIRGDGRVETAYIHRVYYLRPFLRAC